MKGDGKDSVHANLVVNREATQSGFGRPSGHANGAFKIVARRSAGALFALFEFGKS